MINPNLLPFFVDLANHNTKEWFNQRKPDYKAMHQEFAEGLHDVAYRMAQFDLEVRERLDDPTTVKVHRIYNDTRFAKHAPPLKTNISGVISAGPFAPMYYLRIAPGDSVVAGGMYTPPPELLAAIREEVAVSYAELEKLLDEHRLSSTYPTGLDRSIALKTAPKGYAKDDPAIGFLRLKSFTVSRQLSDEEVSSTDFSDRLMDLFEAQYPLHRYLRKAARHVS